MTDLSSFDDVWAHVNVLLNEIASGGGEEQQATISSLPDLPAEIFDKLAASPQRAVQEALSANPTTPPERLRALAGHTDMRIRALVAANPNTPRNSLADLAAAAQQSAAQKSVTLAVARNANADSATLRSLLIGRHGAAVAEPIAANTNAPETLLYHLSAHTDPLVRAAAFQNPQIGSYITGVFNDTAAVAWVGAACNLTAGPDVLDRLATSDSEPVQRTVARHRNVSGDTLGRIVDKVIDDTIDGGDRDMLIEIAKQAHCPPALLDRLAGGVSHDATCDALANPACPPRTIRLIAPRHDDYLSAASGNPSAPPEVIAAAANSADLVTRRGAASNPNLDGALAERLSQGDDGWTLETLAANPATPPGVLMRLGLRGDRDVTDALLTNVNCPPSLLADIAATGNTYQTARVAEHPHCPDDVLERLATSGDTYTTRAVAANANSSPAAIRAALADPETLPHAYMALQARQLTPKAPNIAL